MNMEMNMEMNMLRDHQRDHANATRLLLAEMRRYEVVEAAWRAEPTPATAAAFRESAELALGYIDDELRSVDATIAELKRSGTHEAGLVELRSCRSERASWRDKLAQVVDVLSCTPR